MLKHLATVIACSLLFTANAHAIRGVICSDGHVLSRADFHRQDTCADRCDKVRCGGVLMDCYSACMDREEEAASNGEDHAFERRVLELVNAERAKVGLAPLSYDGALDRAAEKHTAHMAAIGRMGHDDIGDGTAEQRIREEGGIRFAWGENVASALRSPEDVVRAWMNSPSHRANILSSSFRQLGVAYATSSNGTPYWTQVFGG